MIREVTKAIKNSSLDDETKKKLTPKNVIMPRIYDLPKTQKTGIPLRPIVNTIGSPTYDLAKHLAKALKPLVGKTFSFIKYSSELVSKMKEWKMSDNDLLTSFDVVSLYTKIPINEAVEVIKKVSNPETTHLVEICLRSTYFCFQGEIYEQTKGVAKGSPLSPIVANLFMEDLEEKVINSSPQKPRWWLRFVDVVFSNWPHGEDKLVEFQEHLNS